MARTFTREDLEKMLQTLVEKNAKAICETCGETYENEKEWCVCDWDD